MYNRMHDWRCRETARYVTDENYEGFFVPVDDLCPETEGVGEALIVIVLSVDETALDLKGGTETLLGVPLCVLEHLFVKTTLAPFFSLAIPLKNLQV